MCGIIGYTGFRDAKLERLIEELGGSVTSSVSRNTGLIVAKDIHEKSGKMTKAKELGITILSREEFEKKSQNYHALRIPPFWDLLLGLFTLIVGVVIWFVN